MVLRVMQLEEREDVIHFLERCSVLGELERGWFGGRAPLDRDEVLEMITREGVVAIANYYRHWHCTVLLYCHSLIPCFKRLLHFNLYRLEGFCHVYRQQISFLFIVSHPGITVCSNWWNRCNWAHTFL